jgi:methionyl-tRNA formyltransferase
METIDANRILLVGDSKGVRQLLRFVPKQAIAGICMASIRPQYIEDLKELALELGVPAIVQPARSSPDMSIFINQLSNLQADLLLMNSYSMLIPPEALISFPRGCLNLHGSLLPRNRGPNPIQWVIIKGETRTGVTLHRVSPECDQGEIVDQIAFKVSKRDSWLDISENTDRAIDELLAKNLWQILNGGIESQPQEDGVATKNRRRTETDSKFLWSNPVKEIYRLHLAVLPPLPPATAENCNGSAYSFVKKTSFLKLALIVFLKRVACLVSSKGKPPINSRSLRIWE